MARTHLVVFGATGFTAKTVIEELCTRCTSWLPQDFSWAIAGRNERGLRQVAKIVEVAASRGVPEPDIVVADIHDYESLLAMARSTKLVLNCVGPYRWTGEPVVRACIEAGCDYLDLCGEPEFIERMVLTHFTPARAAGVIICHSAAFDSVPCDLAVLASKRYLEARGLSPGSVEMFASLEAKDGLGIHYATYAAAVEGFGSAGIALPQIRKRLTQTMWSTRSPASRPPGPPVRVHKGLLGVSRDARIDGFTIPYFFSDPAVVRLSQALDAYLSTGVPPTHFAAYIVVRGWYVLALLTFYFTIFQALVPFEAGRRLLLAYPKLFTGGLVSHAGPTPKQMSGTSFTQTYFVKGYTKDADKTAKPDLCVRATMTGPEPGYVATPFLILLCAREVILRRDKLERGVVTPAVAFRDVALDMIDALNKDGRIQWRVEETQP
ncbi:hypothetical protein EXIGLDRAFT_772765 [Exidia glandulosa HHB12029]|uniref:Saccharopine dehydrogenase NADP binding domain-containing protein n=1 Tax=Exidia glandulosa HHB12029 TaxID=1314781 RepID=A0A165F4Z4_EXIGL|nr:hypothetical protein EXIGLDRAFT_772765 [Exidia glandulosa HHB12029]